MKHTQSKNNGMKKNMRMLAILLLPVVALILGAAAPFCWADDDDNEVPFDEANIFFELNDTDGDLGIHALIDGEPWKRLKIEDPKGRKMLDIKVKGRLRKQGLTEIFFESAEPTFGELPPAEFFDRFPEGTYEIEGITLEGEELESEVLLTHVMPAPASGITVNRISSLRCDRTVSGDVLIEWTPVTTSHPTIGESGSDIEIIRYQAVAEWEDDDENVFVSSIDLPAPDPEDLPVKMSVTFPADFFRPDTEVKFEVLVREASYNQTAVESCPFEYVVE